MHEMYKQNNLPYLTVKACPKCEHLIDKESHICPHCGYSYDSTETRYDEFATQDVGLPITNVDRQPNYQTNESKIQPEDTILPNESFPNNAEINNEKTEKQNQKQLMKRTICNIIGLVFFLCALIVLLFGSYLSLQKNPDKFTLNPTGIKILSLKTHIYELQNAGIPLYHIFGNQVGIQKFGYYALITIYYLNLASIVIGILYFLINLLKKRRVSFKFVGWLLIPSALLYVFSLVHSILLEHSHFMKSNHLQVNSISNYIFLILFVSWMIIALMLVKDSGEKIYLSKKENNDDLFKD